MTSFTTTVIQAEGKNATGLRVPAEAVAALGTRKNPAVVVNIAGYSYRSTIAAYGDVFMLPLSAEHRVAAGLKAGDLIEVTLELDLAPRTVEIPADLAAVFAEQPDAAAAFAAASPSAQKEYVRQVESAKAEATRTRRITGIVAKLRGL